MSKARIAIMRAIANNAEKGQVNDDTLKECLKELAAATIPECEQIAREVMKTNFNSDLKRIIDDGTE